MGVCCITERSSAQAEQMSSLEQQKANLARIRDNQRRSRARRREYVQDLENRLRICELQGIEASSEVQAAARRVAEENRLLRELLRDKDVSDEAVEQYLQAAGASLQHQPQVASSASASSSTPPLYNAHQSGPGVHILQQSVVPRRAVCFDVPYPVTLPTQADQGGSVTSPAVAASHGWPSGQAPIDGPLANTAMTNTNIAMPITQMTGHNYAGVSMYGGLGLTQAEGFRAHTGGPILDETFQNHYTTQQMPMNNGAAMGYNTSMGAYGNGMSQGFAPSSGP